MKAKDYFKKIYRLKNKIEFKLEKVEFYKYLAQSAGGVIYSDMPRPPKGSVKSPMENAIIKSLDLEREVELDKNELNKLIMEVMGYIEELEDIRLQKILILRYLKDKLWKEIQGELKYSKGTVLNLHKTALSKLDDIISKVCI